MNTNKHKTLLGAAKLLVLVLLLCLQMGVGVVCAQQDGRHVVKGKVSDVRDGSPLPFAAICVMQNEAIVRGVATDASGDFSMVLPSGNYTFVASYVGYETYRQQLSLGSDVVLPIRMGVSSVSLGEVMVTATEQKGLTSTSVINQTAMVHLQPSSFTDLLSLLPGGQTTPPQMGQANVIRLREVGVSNDDYAVSSLGTKFVIDGASVGTDANLQSMPDANSTDADVKRDHTQSGVDMRSITTDNIETVEVIRGIPSVKYGDLTSGVVKIERKLSESPWTARFKADQYGRLVFVGKGFALPNEWTLNADGSFFNSRTDPRNKFETFSRLALSVRSRKVWSRDDETVVRWNSSVDYNANVDDVKTDPEVQINTDDSYASHHHRFALNNAVSYKGRSVLRSLSASHSMSLSVDLLEQTRRVVLSQDSYVPVMYADGEYDAEVLPNDYVANYRVEGLPFYSTLKADADLHAQTGAVSHEISVGADWQYNKNFGEGHVYDVSRPLHGTTSRRPRSFKDIPATSILGLYAQDNLTVELGEAKAALMVGLRTTNMLGLDDDYAVSGRLYADPRVNAQVDFPKLGGLKLYVAGGVGRMCKMPTIGQLAPDPLYLDVTQLNFYHSNADFRLVNIKTTVVDRNSYELTPAHNLKREVRIGGDYGQHVFSATWFKETMDDGFRSQTKVLPIQYKDYDVTSVDALSLTARPSVSDFTYATDTTLRTFSSTGNGTRIVKRGVEFQYTSPRLPVVNMRLTVNGAWLKTTYENSEPEWYAGVGTVILGQRVNSKYVGLYDWKNGYVKERATTNFVVDTYIDRLGFIFSVTAECFWRGKSDSPSRAQAPIAYVGVDGVVHAYTEESRQDMMLNALDLSETTSTVSSTERAYACFHAKATKKFGPMATLSFFADRLLNAARDYEKNGFVIRRVFLPYFGMELNLKI